MTKYIIKNCPSFVLMQNAKQTYFDVCGQGKIGTLCKDCTGCLLKRIVEKCEQYKKDYITTNGVWLLANEISSMLEIEECEE